MEVTVVGVVVLVGPATAAAAATGPMEDIGRLNLGHLQVWAPGRRGSKRYRCLILVVPVGHRSIPSLGRSDAPWGQTGLLAEGGATLAFIVDADRHCLPSRL